MALDLRDPSSGLDLGDSGGGSAPTQGSTHVTVVPSLRRSASIGALSIGLSLLQSTLAPVPQAPVGEQLTQTPTVRRSAIIVEIGVLPTDDATPPIRPIQWTLPERLARRLPPGFVLGYTPPSVASPLAGDVHDLPTRKTPQSPAFVQARAVYTQPDAPTLGRATDMPPMRPTRLVGDVESTRIDEVDPIGRIAPPLPPPQLPPPAVGFERRALIAEITPVGRTAQPLPPPSRVPPRVGFERRALIAEVEPIGSVAPPLPPAAKVPPAVGFERRALITEVDPVGQSAQPLPPPAEVPPSVGFEHRALIAETDPAGRTSQTLPVRLLLPPLVGDTHNGFRDVIVDTPVIGRPMDLPMRPTVAPVGGSLGRIVPADADAAVRPPIWSVPLQRGAQPPEGTRGVTPDAARPISVVADDLPLSRRSTPPDATRGRIVPPDAEPPVAGVAGRVPLARPTPPADATRGRIVPPDAEPPVAGNADRVPLARLTPPQDATRGRIVPPDAEPPFVASSVDLVRPRALQPQDWLTAAPLALLTQETPVRGVADGVPLRRGVAPPDIAPQITALLPTATAPVGVQSFPPPAPRLPQLMTDVSVYPTDDADLALRPAEWPLPPQPPVRLQGYTTSQVPPDQTALPPTSTLWPVPLRASAPLVGFELRARIDETDPIGHVALDLPRRAGAPLVGTVVGAPLALLAPEFPAGHVEAADPRRAAVPLLVGFTQRARIEEVEPVGRSAQPLPTPRAVPPAVGFERSALIAEVDPVGHAHVTVPDRGYVPLVGSASASPLALYAVAAQTPPVGRASQPLPTRAVPPLVGLTQRALIAEVDPVGHQELARIVVTPTRVGSTQGTPNTLTSAPQGTPFNGSAAPLPTRQPLVVPPSITVFAALEEVVAPPPGPVLGTGHLARSDREHARRARLAAPLGWRDSFERGPEAEPWIQPVSGTKALATASQARRARALATTSLLWRGAEFDGPEAEPSQPPVAGSTSRLDALAKARAARVRAALRFLWTTAQDASYVEPTEIQPVQGTAQVRRATDAYRRRALVALRLVFEQAQAQPEEQPITDIQPVQGTGALHRQTIARAAALRVALRTIWTQPEDETTDTGTTELYIQPVVGTGHLRARSARWTRAARLATQMLLAHGVELPPSQRGQTIWDFIADYLQALDLDATLTADIEFVADRRDLVEAITDITQRADIFEFTVDVESAFEVEVTRKYPEL